MMDEDSLWIDREVGEEPGGCKGCKGCKGYAADRDGWARLRNQDEGIK